MRQRSAPADVAATERTLRPTSVHWLHAPAESADSPVTQLRYPRGAVVLLGGIPGAGKTTLLGRVAAPSTEARLLDSDAWRTRLSSRLPGFVPYATWRPLVHLLHYATTAHALAGHQTLVVHECATRTILRRWLVRLARRAGRPAHLVLLDVDLPAAWQGQATRGRMVRRSPLRRHWARWQALRTRLRDPRSAAAVLRHEGWSSCVVMDRTAANRLTTFHFQADEAPSAQRGHADWNRPNRMATDGCAGPERPELSAAVWKFVRGRGRSSVGARRQGPERPGWRLLVMLLGCSRVGRGGGRCGFVTRSVGA